MSQMSGFIYLIAILLIPVVLIALMVYLVVSLTNAENKRAAIAKANAISLTPIGKVEIEIFRSFGMAIYGLILSLFLCGFGIFTFFLDPVAALVLGTPTLLAAIPFTFMGIKQLFDNEPNVVITDTHIECKQWPFRRIAWKEIKSVNRLRFMTAGAYAVYINLEVYDEKKVMTHMGSIKKIIYKLNRIFGGSPIAINLTSLKADSDLLLKMVQQHLIAKQ